MEVLLCMAVVAVMAGVSMFFADAPAGGGQPAPEPAPKPAQPSPPPAQPAKPAAPVPAEPAAPQMPDLHPDLLIDRDGAEGVKLGDAMNAYDALKALGGTDPQSLAKLQNLKRAMIDGDVEAQRELMTAALPPKDDPAAQVPEWFKPFAAKVDELTEAVSTARPIVDTVSRAQKIQNVSALIQHHAEKLPHLAHDPASAAAVANRVDQLEANLRAHGTDPKTLTQQQASQLWAQALQAEEGSRVKLLAAYGHAFTPTTGQKPGEKPAVVDDQTPNPVSSTSAQYVVRNGQVFDQSGQQVQQMPEGTMQPVSTQVPPANVAGQPPAAAAPSRTQGPHNRGNLVEQMRQDRAAKEGGQ